MENLEKVEKVDEHQSSLVEKDSSPGGDSESYLLIRANENMRLCIPFRDATTTLHLKKGYRYYIPKKIADILLKNKEHKWITKVSIPPSLWRVHINGKKLRPVYNYALSDTSPGKSLTEGMKIY